MPDFASLRRGPVHSVGGGVPLGIGDNVGARDWVITVPPRSWVIFYTDGMTEYEAEHGRSSPIIFKARATIGGDYDQSVALAELRAELEEALDAAVWA